MSISQKISTTTSAISEITTENLESQKPRATSAAEDIESEWARIAGLVREAQGNDTAITSSITEARADLNTLGSARDVFLTTLGRLQRDLEEAHSRFSTALVDAQNAFNEALVNAQDEISGDLSSLETANESNKKLHREIETLAS